MFANFKYPICRMKKEEEHNMHIMSLRGVTDDNNTSKNSTFVQDREREKNLPFAFYYITNICPHKALMSKKKLLPYKLV